MTPNEIRLVQDSFRAVLPMREAAAALFYERLFAIDADLRVLFQGTDMARQGAMLMASLGFVVQGLTRADSILPAVRELARRHVNYGVKEHHYAIVGQALIETLAAGLGKAFTSEVRAAWQEAFGLLASVMIAAASDESFRNASAISNLLADPGIETGGGPSSGRSARARKIGADAALSQ